MFLIDFNVFPFPSPYGLTWRLVIWSPGPEAVIGVEIHGVDVLLPLSLLHSHGGFVGGENGRGETEAPVNRQPAEWKYFTSHTNALEIFKFALILLFSQMCTNLWFRSFDSSFSFDSHLILYDWINSQATPTPLRLYLTESRVHSTQ